MSDMSGISEDMQDVPLCGFSENRVRYRRVRWSIDHDNTRRKICYILALLVIIIYLYYHYIHSPLKIWDVKGVPHPKPWPIVGNMGPVVFQETSMHEHLHNIYSTFEDERYYGIHQFMDPQIVVKDLDLIKQITIKDSDSFLDHRPFLNKDTEPLFSKMLLMLTGQRWKDMRTVLSPAFTGSKLRLIFLHLSDISERFTNYFCRKVEEDILEVEMKDLFTRFTTDAIASVAFGIQSDSLSNPKNEFYTSGKNLMSINYSRLLAFFSNAISPQLTKLLNIKLFPNKVVKFFSNLIEGTIKLRKDSGLVRIDMIHLLLEAQKSDHGLPFDDKDVIAQALGFFLAGYDSVSGIMCHMANELAVNPHVQRKLLAEIDETLAYSDDGKIDYATLQKMKYLNMVLHETLRKWPVTFATDRVCTKPYQLPGSLRGKDPLQINLGDTIVIPIYSIHRDPKHYPNPNDFDPERFADDKRQNINATAYLPFGIGPRNCIGARLAILEIKTLFVNFLAKFEFVVVKKTQIPLKMSKTQFSLASERGFWLGIKSRHK